VEEAEHHDQDASDLIKKIFGRNRSLATRMKKSPSKMDPVYLAAPSNAPLPVSLFELFNDMWYTNSTHETPNEDLSVVSKLLAEATDVTWDLPWPNVLDNSANNHSLVNRLYEQITGIGRALSPSSCSKAEATLLHHNKLWKEQKQVLLAGMCIL
jgi:hypothetical protein